MKLKRITKEEAMAIQPKTKEEAEEFRYGVWVGNPQGAPYIRTRCAYQVWNQWQSQQCSRKRRHDSIFCTYHLKVMEPTTLKKFSRFTFRIDEDDLELLNALSIKLQRSRSDTIRVLIRKAAKQLLA